MVRINGEPLTSDECRSLADLLLGLGVATHVSRHPRDIHSLLWCPEPQCAAVVAARNRLMDLALELDVAAALAKAADQRERA